MLLAAVLSSRGIGLPSAGIRDGDDELVGCEKRGGNEKGRELRLALEDGAVVLLSGGAGLEADTVARSAWDVVMEIDG